MPNTLDDLLGSIGREMLIAEVGIGYSRFGAHCLEAMKWALQKIGMDEESATAEVVNAGEMLNATGYLKLLRLKARYVNLESMLDKDEFAGKLDGATALRVVKKAYKNTGSSEQQALNAVAFVKFVATANYYPKLSGKPLPPP